MDMNVLSNVNDNLSTYGQWSTSKPQNIRYLSNHQNIIFDSIRGVTIEYRYLFKHIKNKNIGVKKGVHN